MTGKSIAMFHVLEIFANIFNDSRPCDKGIASPIILIGNKKSAHVVMKVSVVKRYTLCSPTKENDFSQSQAVRSMRRNIRTHNKIQKSLTMALLLVLETKMLCSG